MFTALAEQPGQDPEVMRFRFAAATNAASCGTSSVFLAVQFRLSWNTIFTVKMRFAPRAVDRERAPVAVVAAAVAVGSGEETAAAAVNEVSKVVIDREETRRQSPADLVVAIVDLGNVGRLPDVRPLVTFTG
jgi:hypothetical protein